MEQGPPPQPPPSLPRDREVAPSLRSGNPLQDTPSSKVRALLDYLEHTLQDTAPPLSRAGSDDRVLFLGAWHSSVPRLILHDPLLSSDAKVLWGLIKDYADPRTLGLLPDPALLCRKLRRGSRNTLALALTELRLLRLLSLHPRPRTAGGRYSGNLYLLHDEPLSLADALYLDPDYLHLLRASTSHLNKGIRQLADTVRCALDQQLDHDTDPLEATTLPHRTARHLAQRLTERGPEQEFLSHTYAALVDDNPFLPAGCAPPAAPSEDHSPPNREDINLKTPPKAESSLENHRAQILSMDNHHRAQNLSMDQNLIHAQNLSTVKMRSSSSIYINNKTTTTPPTPPPSKSDPLDGASTLDEPGGPGWATPRDDGRNLPPLVWPPSLAAVEHDLCALLLEAVPSPYHQPLLDELEGRIRWGKTEGQPLRRPMSWFKKLCANAHQNTFMPDLGLAIKAAREKRFSPPAPSAQPAERGKPIDREAGKAGVAQLRKAMGLGR